MIPHCTLVNNVVIFSLFPGIREDHVRHLLNTPDLRAMVMRTFGSGNAPQAAWLTQALSEAHDHGKVIVNVSQCMAGSVEMARYDAGFHLKEAGVTSGYDSTVESAVTKLMYVMGRSNDPDEIRYYMSQSIRGEISI